MGTGARDKRVVAGLWLLCGATLANQKAQAAEGLRPLLGFTAGSSGYGLQAGLQIDPRLSLRFVMNAWSHAGSVALDGLNYQMKARVEMPQLLLDYRPFDSGFYLAGGLTLNRTEFKGLATLSGPIEIGTETVQPEDVSGLLSRAKYHSTTPYFGLGWRSGVRRKLGIHFEAGVTALPGMQVSLEELDSTALSRAALDAEASRIAADLDDGLSFYPHLRLGVQYRF